MERNYYGALVSPEAVELGRVLIELAQRTNKLPDEYMTRDDKKSRRLNKFIGEALNIDVYDVMPSGSAALVQVRETEGHKYGMSVTKDYFIVRKCGRGVVVTEADKARACKIAKSVTKLGDAIGVLEGKLLVKIKSAVTRRRAA